ncbi:uncharacterized protein M421DRAFT_282261 [Didymella exigua CBS 183.55]|uniref:Uncharacterized protein n=1 Tax=Didymella exigua CBS 183.55 TaxID=1150837 RepID=A0A6A5RXC5_9PLEO|nr:uncharacterized protein M421DRAFT_282261 [Didymella exigua CBS 183.55]KAF1932000.1 hypothetical protein M421DRAFT_282261 [Didymella exigua CBS 183.55]
MRGSGSSLDCALQPRKHGASQRLCTLHERCWTRFVHDPDMQYHSSVAPFNIEPHTQRSHRIGPASSSFQQTVEHDTPHMHVGRSMDVTYVLSFGQNYIHSLRQCIPLSSELRKRSKFTMYTAVPEPAKPFTQTVYARAHVKKPSPKMVQ